MATTLLTDIIQPNIFAKAVTEAVTSKSALLSSGAIIRSNLMDQKAAEAGQSGTLPLFGAQAWSAPDIAKSDTTQATVNNAGMVPQVYQTDYISKTWGSSALTDAVSGEDILGHIVNEVVAPYFAETIHQYALSKLSGLIKDNVANDGGDMVSSIGTDAALPLTTATTPNVGTFVDAMQSMGDARAKIALIIMHSAVFSYLLKNDTANTVRASATVPFDNYMGIPVILDDSMPKTVGTNRTTYTCYLMAKGTFAYGEANLGAAAVGLKMDELGGNGFSQTTLTYRKQIILHPVGFSSSATIASGFGSPTLAAYDTASAWDRKVNRKNAPIVAFKVNA